MTMAGPLKREASEMFRRFVYLHGEVFIRPESAMKEESGSSLPTVS